MKEVIYKVDDKVIAISKELHETSDMFYPKPGTSGIVVQIDRQYLLIQWEAESTSLGDRWWALPWEIELVEIANP